MPDWLAAGDFGIGAVGAASWIGLLLLLGSARLADKRFTILALWGSGILSGLAFLLEGLEFYALAVWWVSTLMALVNVYFAILFGEFRPNPQSVDQRPKVIVVGAVTGLFAVALLGVYRVWGGLIQTRANEMLGPLGARETFEVSATRFFQEHGLALLSLACLLFGVSAGSGYLSRVTQEKAGDKP